MELKDDSDNHQLKSIVLEQNTLEVAIAHFQKAIVLNPHCAETHNALGECLVQKGDLAKAMLCFRRAIGLNPDSAWYHQNLGNVVSLNKASSRSYELYYRALELNPDLVQRWKQCFEPAFIPSQSDLASYPIFIIGCGHSGTSVMLAMLGNHPALYPIPQESKAFLQPENRVQSTLEIWDRECLTSGKKRWVEKTPYHVFYIYKIWKYRPKSQLIVMVRDGRDVVCSLKRRKARFKTFEQCLDRWIYDNMATFPYYDNPRLKMVKYEDLVTQPEATMREILTFLGEPYSAEVLQFYQTPKHWYSSDIKRPEAIETDQDNLKLRNWQINQPLFDGRGRWRQEMTSEEKELFKSHCHSKAQKQLERFGYVEDDNW